MPLPTDKTARRIALLATLGVAMFIAYATLTPMPHVPGPPGADKAGHLVAFALLTLPLAVVAPRHLLWLLPLGIAYGGAIELIQPHVGRSRELADFLSDGAGAVIGSVAGLALRMFLRR
ncbi:MAG: VanZ family protein [Pseudooceanicola sp.]|nr:VanZ family protein [Pseudooceanicola sp.]